MKKVVIIIVALICMMNCLTACGGTESINEERNASLIGTWTNDEGRLELRDDGSGKIKSVYLIGDVEWKLEDGFLYFLTDDNRKTVFAYDINDEKLSLTYMQESAQEINYTYERINLKKDKNPLIGIWKLTTAFDKPFIYEYKREFLKDGSGMNTFVNDKNEGTRTFQWHEKDNVLVYEDDQGMCKYEYNIEDDILTLKQTYSVLFFSPEVGNFTIVFERF